MSRRTKCTLKRWHVCHPLIGFGNRESQTCRELWVDTTLDLVPTFCAGCLRNRQLQPSRVFLKHCSDGSLFSGVDNRVVFQRVVLEDGPPPPETKTGTRVHLDVPHRTGHTHGTSGTHTHTHTHTTHTRTRGHTHTHTHTHTRHTHTLLSHGDFHFWHCAIRTRTRTTHTHTRHSCARSLSHSLSLLSVVTLLSLSVTLVPITLSAPRYLKH